MGCVPSRQTGSAYIIEPGFTGYAMKSSSTNNKAPPTAAAIRAGGVITLQPSEQAVVEQFIERMQTVLPAEMLAKCGEIAAEPAVMKFIRGEYATTIEDDQRERFRQQGKAATLWLINALVFAPYGPPTVAKLIRQLLGTRSFTNNLGAMDMWKPLRAGALLLLRKTGNMSLRPVYAFHDLRTAMGNDVLQHYFQFHPQYCLWSVRPPTG